MMKQFGEAKVDFAQQTTRLYFPLPEQNDGAAHFALALGMPW